MSEESVTQNVLVSALRRLDSARPPGLLPAAGALFAEACGVTELSVHLVDYSSRLLARIDHRDPDQVTSVSGVEEGDVGMTYRSQQVSVTSQVDETPMRATATALVDPTEQDQEPEQWRVLLPLTVRAERLGVLEVRLPELPTTSLLAVLRSLTADLGYALNTASAYTDIYEHVRRREALSLPAEIQWGLLPVLAYEADDLSLAGEMLPAYDLAGDTFDYAVDKSVATVSVTDGMGHGLRAAVLASVTVAALRNARRRGAPVAAQAAAADQALLEQFGGAQYATGLVVSLDLETGLAQVVNAGHPAPLLLRHTPGALPEVSEVVLRSDLPMGLFERTTYRAQEVQLQPGDRLLMVTDGLLEAASPSRRRDDDFGRHLPPLLTETAGLPASETLRRITQALLGETAGRLRDDCTAVCLDWRGRAADPAA